MKWPAGWYAFVNPWGPKAGSGGKLDMTKNDKGEPYIRGPCESGHRIPRPVMCPIQNSFTGYKGTKETLVRKPAHDD